MNPEMWKELRHWMELHALRYDSARLALDKMAELERRALPKRVAEILKKVDVNKRFCSTLYGQTIDPSTTFCRYRTLQDFWDRIIMTLETGDTSEIERWIEE